MLSKWEQADCAGGELRARRVQGRRYGREGGSRFPLPWRPLQTALKLLKYTKNNQNSIEYAKKYQNSIEYIQNYKNNLTYSKKYQNKLNTLTLQKHNHIITLEKWCPNGSRLTVLAEDCVPAGCKVVVTDVKKEADPHYLGVYFDIHGLRSVAVFLVYFIVLLYIPEQA